MKKQPSVYILLSIIFIVGMVLGGCATAQNTPTSAPTASTIKVALVLDGKIDDGGWNQAGYEGLMAAQKEYGVDVAYSESVAIPDYEKVLRDYASKGYNLIIAHSSIAKDAVMNTAKDYPKLAFLWTDGDETASNVAVIRPMSQEASYLAGLLAGKMTKSNIVGMVGGIDIPSTHRSSAAFELGLKAANPNAKLLTNWIGSFTDVSKGNEAATSQIESGADLIFGNGDGQNIGVLKAASDKNVLAIGAVRDQFSIAPNVVLTSVEWGFNTGIVMAVKDCIDGNFTGKFYDIGLAQGADLAPYHDNASKIPADVQTLVKQNRDDILSGKLQVPNVPMGQ
jgi:basic membrane protein A